MTASARFVAREVRCGISKLAHDVAREVPIQKLAIPRNAGTRRLLDHTKARLIDLLEKKRGIISSNVPSAFQNRVGRPIESLSRLGMLELGKIVIKSMNNHGAVSDMVITDRTTVETVSGFPTHALRETESQEPDTRHEQQDDADKTHFFSPCTLLFRTPYALGE